MSSFLGTGGACSFNLDLISSTSGCSSTLSKSSSVSSLSISTKRARGPRKRPNQSYVEAATLLSTACPNVFSVKNLHKKYSASLSSLSSSSLSSSDIIPPLPIFSETDFLIEEPCLDLNPSLHFKIKPITPVPQTEESCIVVREASPPCSPPGYDVDSIFDDESVEGIDSIMGKLSVNDCDSNPFIGGPMGLGIRGKCGPSFGLGQHGNNIPQALRGNHCEDWWRQVPMVQMKDIVPKFNPLPLLGKKTRAKKKKLEELEDGHVTTRTTIATSITSTCKLFTEVNSGLGLKLNYEEVAEAWGDRGYLLPCDPDTLESSAEIATMGEVDLLPETEGVGMREASVQRYLEKRRTRDFSNKIRYQVRKANADCKPRMKGRFVRKTPFLHDASREENE